MLVVHWRNSTEDALLCSFLHFQKKITRMRVDLTNIEEWKLKKIFETLQTAFEYSLITVSIGAMSYGNAQQNTVAATEPRSSYYAKLTWVIECAFTWVDLVQKMLSKEVHFAASFQSEFVKNICTYGLFHISMAGQLLLDVYPLLRMRRIIAYRLRKISYFRQTSTS